MGQAKIPDIEKCLEVVGTLEARKGTGEVRCLFLVPFSLLLYFDTFLHCFFLDIDTLMFLRLNMR